MDRELLKKSESEESSGPASIICCDVTELIFNDQEEKNLFLLE